MAARKFYKKIAPNTKPVLSNGATVEFRTLNNLVGYFSTENDFIQAEFAQFMGSARYGITEISAQEYETDYRSKKNNLPQSLNLKPDWREEVGPGALGLSQIRQASPSPSEVAAVAVSGTDIKRNPVTAAVPTRETLPPQPKTAEEFKPRTGKRKAKTDK